MIVVLPRAPNLLRFKQITEKITSIIAITTVL